MVFPDFCQKFYVPVNQKLRKKLPINEYDHILIDIIFDKNDFFFNIHN